MWPSDIWIRVDGLMSCHAMHTIATPLFAGATGSPCNASFVTLRDSVPPTQGDEIPSPGLAGLSKQPIYILTEGCGSMMRLR
jgi:hypothetical protein